MKRFFIILITFITVFLPQSQSWAAVKNSDKIVQNINVSIDKSTFLVNDDSPAIISQRKRATVPDNNYSSAWIGSIFITGLGQMIMGNFFKGIIFALLSYGSFFISFINLFSFSRGSGTNALLFWIASLIFHIWNIVDAYNMSRESGDNNLDSEELSKLEDKLKTTMNNFNNIQISDNGNVSVTALSF